MRVAIVGGGPGGLLTSYLLQNRTSARLRIKLFEASDRLGGKLFTVKFDSTPVQYEAGTAELYGYAHVASDPLFNLIQGLGLRTLNLHGKTVVMDGEILDHPESIGQHLGTKALYAIQNFHSEARRRVRALDYYNSGWPDENKNPLVRKSFRSLLAKVPSSRARRYLEVAVHSDLATEPARTHALYGLHNVLLEHDDYVRLYAIEGGMERLTGALGKKLAAHLALRSRVVAVEGTKSGKYVVYYDSFGSSLNEKFDAIVIALPACQLTDLEWRGSRLNRRMNKHVAYYDGAAHYLKVCMLFKQPFWRTVINSSFFQLDRLGGCCVYDEGKRLDAGPYGVLNMLLAGTSAMLLGNRSDTELVSLALSALPDRLGPARDYFLEGKVHRWVGSVSAPRVSFRVRGPRARHFPNSKKHPGLFVVGDYLFDDTVNGVLELRRYRIWARGKVSRAEAASLPVGCATCPMARGRQYRRYYKEYG